MPQMGLFVRDQSLSVAKKLRRRADTFSGRIRTIAAGCLTLSFFGAEEGSVTKAIDPRC